MSKIVGTVRHLQDFINFVGYERTRKLCSDFHFFRKVSKRQISFRVVFCYFTQGISSFERKDLLQPKAKDILYIEFVFLFLQSSH